MPRWTGRYIGEEEALGIVVSGKNPDGTPYRLPAEATNAAAIAVGEARFFWAGIGKIALTAAGNLRSLIENPSGSGKKVMLARMTAFASAGPAWSMIYINPATGLPATAARPVNNAIIANANPSVTIIRADTDLTVALGGGTDTGVAIGIPSGERVSLDLPPFVLLPGTTMGINNAFAGAADATMTIYWWEEAV